MADGLAKQDFIQALQALGRRVSGQTEIVLGGAGALILTGELDRVTDDGDVLRSPPDIGQLQADIRAVAESLDLPGGWLNGSIQSYGDVLPPDYASRLKSLPAWGKLQVAVLHRKDVIVMKLFAGRPRDITDVMALTPSHEELAFVRSQVPRLSRIDETRANRLAALIDRWQTT
jgi:hypothetical protein